MRARLSTDMRGKYRGLVSGLFLVAREEGALRLYRGLVPSLVGIIPYVGIDFMVYGELKQFFASDPYMVALFAGPDSVYGKLVAGAIAGVCGQTVSYPLDTVRRILQVQDVKLQGRKYTGMLDCLVRVSREEGVAALYRGLGANYIKVVPSVAVSFTVFEYAKQALLGSIR